MACNILDLSGGVCYNSFKLTGEKIRMGSIFEDIANLNKSGMRFGVETTRRILDKLGSPDDKLKIIHIAGTNGKGSIAEFITEILVAAGKRTGTFTSPMVESYFDQFKIDGKPIKEEVLSPYFKRAYAAAEGTATEFEVETAGALLAFAEEGCEYAVVECGLGGKLDATNAINSKLLAVISSVSLEHTAYLGNTIEEICAHKAGIIKNCPAVVNSLQTPEARAYFKKLGVIFADKGLAVRLNNLDCTKFSYDDREYLAHLPVDEYVDNAATAIEAAHQLGIDENAIQVGILRSKLAGRLQLFNVCGNTYLVDGGHNPAAMLPLADMLKYFPKEEVTFIYGSLSDKDIDGNLKAIKDCAQRIIAVKPDSPRAMELTKISLACKKYFAEVKEAANVSSALDNSKGVVVVCGSFTLVKEALNWIEKRL